MEGRRACSDGPSTGTGTHRTMDTECRPSSRKPMQRMLGDLSNSHGAIPAHREHNRYHNRSTLRSTLSAAARALALCTALLAPVVRVNAEDSLVFHVPAEVTLCFPVNFTWTGGTPPYKLDVETPVNGPLNDTALERKTGIQPTWFVWTPDFPAGSRLDINIVGSGSTPSAGGFANVSSSSDSSCLNETSTITTATSSSPSSSSSTGGVVTLVNQPSVTVSPTILASSGSGLSKGAIAGVAVAAALAGMGLTAIGVWCLVRRQHRQPHLEKGYERNIASPSEHYSSAQVSSALVDVPSMSALRSSSNIPEGNNTLRARPYLVEREPITSAGGSQLRALGPSKRHLRELLDPTSTLNAASPSDACAQPPSPPQFRYADPLDPGNGHGVRNLHREGNEPEDIARQDMKGATPPSRAVEVGLENRNRDMGVSDVASNISDVTPPPPYSTISGV